MMCWACMDDGWRRRQVPHECIPESRNAHYKNGGRQSSWQKVSELEFHFDTEEK